MNTSIDSEAEHSVVSPLPLIEHNAGLDTATFEDKLRYFDLLDVRGKLAFENNEKVVYIKCKAGKQRVSLAVTSHSSGGQLVNSLPITLTARLVLGLENGIFAVNTIAAIMD